DGWKEPAAHKLAYIFQIIVIICITLHLCSSEFSAIPARRLSHTEQGVCPWCHSRATKLLGRILGFSKLYVIVSFRAASRRSASHLRDIAPESRQTFGTAKQGREVG